MPPPAAVPPQKELDAHTTCLGMDGRRNEPH